MTSNEKNLQQILDIGIALTAEKEPDKLLDLIVSTAMELTGSDAGTLYIVNGNTLEFKIMKTISKGINVGGNGEKIDLPPVPMSLENICTYAVIKKETLNIEDVYESDLFDFSGPKRYDDLNDYHTKSMVCIPMIDNTDEVIGVMQLINATENGVIRPYTKEEERILLSLASQTAISLANMAYVDELNKQLWSFTEALTEAIDARTPYNASHTRKVAEYAGLIADRINELHAEGKEDYFFSKEQKEQLIMAAFLHDIGKMVVPVSVMNKSTRLEHSIEPIKKRLENIKLRAEIDYLKNKITKEEYEKVVGEADETSEVVLSTNVAGFIDDEKKALIDKVCEYKYISPDGNEEIAFLQDNEKECLKIEKGTLSDDERAIMESHVEMTERILSKVHFNKSFAMAPVFASQHHEFINGSGYPKKISGKELSIESRILAVADICDALLATDRPYKKPMPKEKAFAIMNSMVKEGKLEARLVDYLMEKIDDTSTVVL
ncbi:MAG: HD domain-containing phosphohydrolase [Lachnospiraceae bacterium]|nr:HD domain-containing phosphohydrolase [Lachnospiraceae bacterium]